MHNFERVMASVFEAIPDEIARAYKKIFDSIDGELVLTHLAEVCGATGSAADEGPHALAVAEGRRQVWLMIQDCLCLDERDLRAMRRAVADEFVEYER